MTVDLTTTYLGLELSNPLVISACPMTEDLDVLARLAEAGAAAAVFPSLFEEQIEREELEVHGFYEQATESFAESLTYFPEMQQYNVGPEVYLRRIEAAKARVDIPIIGSLNGISRGGWVHYARLIEQAGADALELNAYLLPVDPTHSAAHVEDRLLELVAAVKQSISVPLAVKLMPFYSSPAHLAGRLVEAGADGLVLFNRFVHPDIDLETLTLQPRLELSRSYDALLPMTWIALLRGRLETSLAATTGVHAAADALKLLLAGADATMMASAVYRHGVTHVTTVLQDMRAWLDAREYASIEQMKGSMSQEHCADPSAYERAGYLRTLASFTSRSV